MNRLFFYFLSSIVFCTVIGCGDSKNNPLSDSITSRPSIEFKDSVAPVIVIGAEGGISTLTFTASEAWSAEVNAVTRTVDWISVSPTSGGPATVNLQITVQPNENYEERNAAIYLHSGSIQKIVTITQKQKDGLLLTSNKVELDASGGEFAIKLETNVTVTADIEKSARSWITTVRTRNLTSSTLYFSAIENENLEPRQAIITLKGNDLTEQVTVYQAGNKPTIVLSQKNYIVPSAGETIQVELKSNTAYKVIMPPDAPWISESKTRVISAYTHFYQVAPNDTYDSRTCEICFVDEVNREEEKITVTQMQQNAILVAQNEYTIEATGGTLIFFVNANVDFNVETSVDWIQQTNTRGLIENQLLFNISENANETSRHGIVTIRSGELKQEIRITQEGVIKPYLRVSPKEFTVSAKGGNIEFVVETNVEVNVSSDKWCYQKEEGIYTFTIEPNTQNIQRKTEIRVESPEYNLSEIVQVTQEAFEPYLHVSPKEFTVSAKGGNIEFVVETNAEVDIISSASWCYWNAENPYTFIIEPNTQALQRKAEISVKCPEYGLSEVIQVTQKGATGVDSNIEDMPTEEW